MIQSVSAIPVYNDREASEAKKLTGLGIFIKCGLNDAEEIFKLLHKIGRRDLDKPKDAPSELYECGIDIIRYFTESDDEVRTSCQLYGHWDTLTPEMVAKICGGSTPVLRKSQEVKND